MSGERKLFGTDGIRGRANVYPMTGEVMFELGRALAMVFRLMPSEKVERRVLIGRHREREGLGAALLALEERGESAVHVLEGDGSSSGCQSFCEFFPMTLIVYCPSGKPVSVIGVATATTLPSSTASAACSCAIQPMRVD